MASTLTEHLRALPDGALAAVFSRRPDLLTPPPTDISALAARAQSRVSVARALDGLDLFTIEVLDAARLTRDPRDGGTTSLAAVLALTATAEAEQVRSAVRRLQDLVILYGHTTECVGQLLRHDQDISILVLASGTGKEGPGPLVSMFGATVQSIPVTIVPGNFTDEQIDALA